IDFTDVVVFEEATTYPIILIAIKSTTKKNFSFFKFTKNNYLEKDQLDLDSAYTTVSQSNLSSNAWNFISSFEQNILDKIQSNKTIVELFGKSYRGILTGLNEAFITKNFWGDNHVLYDIYDGKDLSKWVTPPP